MVLILPIGGIVWLLIWLFRALRGKSAPQTAGPAPQTRGTQVAVFQTLLFLLAYFPLAVWAAIYVANRNPGAWSGLAFGVTLFVLCSGPYWLAWRVLGPFGLPVLGRLALYLAPCIELESFQGNQELFSAAFGGTPKPSRWTATPWLFFVIALRRESEGSADGIDQLLEFLDARPPRRLPRRLRTQGVELLAWPALRQGDWEEAQRRLTPGRGRGVRLLRSLAAAHLAPAGKAPSALLLWLAWLLAPERRCTMSLVRSALASPPAPEARRAAAPAAAAAAEDGVWHLHLQLLARAAAGRAVSAADVEALAVGWEAVLGRKIYLRLLTRAVELGSPDAQAAAAALRPAVEAELMALAETVEGVWPEPARPGLVAKLRRRRLDRLFSAIQAEVEPFQGHDFASFPRKLDTPLAEMERWLQFRLSLQRLLASNAEALPTAWYNGLRLAACNWPVYLLRAHGPAAHWACREMSVWCETLAREVGDQEIIKLSHGNSRVGRLRLFRR
ncbi:MAG TPA: hypothetical protein VGS07_24090 [Thermoanaerobaculia bacterium]|jgi:hypothetical protein|nr:hypothetical protein [Thermoanaerobaculia bacterium]